MSVVDEEIYTHLTNTTGLTALTTQIWPYDPPQGAPWPLVTYSKVSGDREHAMGNDPNVTHSMFEFRVEADDPLECRNVSVQVMAAMDRWTLTTGGVAVQETLRQYEFAGVDYVGADDRKVYFNEIGFMIHHGE